MKKLICFIIAIILCLSCSVINNTQKIVYASDTKLNLDCKAYILMDYNSGKILMENNSAEKLQVASMVKLMTSLLVMEKIENDEWNLDTKLMTSSYAASMEGSQAFLDAGQEYTVDELLKSVIIASANDSSVVLAENYAGSEQNFVEIMNKKAKELGMNNTLYENSTGLPTLNEYSCAEDIAIILKEVCKHDLYHKYSTIWMDSLIHKSGRKTELVNTNRLIKYYPGCDCGKTGFTDEAGYCLSASAVKNNLRLISVVIGCKSSQARFELSSTLLNYGFANYESKKVVDKENFIEYTGKIKGLKEQMQILPERDCFVTSKRNNNNEIDVKIEFNHKLKLPILKNTVLGKIIVTENGIVIDEINLISQFNYEKQGYFSNIEEILSNWAI